MFRFGTQCCAKIIVPQCGKFQMPSKLNKLKAPLVICETVRTANFFLKLSSDEMWKAMTTVSNQGKKKGRGKKFKNLKKLNLDKGQVVGTGVDNILWPGLNAPIIENRELQDIQQLPKDSRYHEKLLESRTETKKKKRVPVHPLERGWTSNTLLGKHLDPPEAVDGENYEDFICIPIDLKHLSRMTGHLGRVRSVSASVISGNGKGLVGLGRAKAKDVPTAVRKAQKQSLNTLLHYELIDGHTINHDFHYQFGLTHILAQKRQKGYGLVCHRIIQKICMLIGIKDLYAKVSGSTNPLHIVKAFLLGLREQKTYQQLADEVKLHLVEFRKERNYYPELLASPSEILSHEEALRRGIPNVTEYVLNGKLPYKKDKSKITEITPGYMKHLKRTVYERNHKGVMLKLLAEYGRYQSFLTEIYPECEHSKMKE